MTMKVVFCCCTILLMNLSTFWCETIILTDLTPEEAQSRLATKSLDVSYAKLLGQRSLGSSDVNKIFHQGRLIEKPEQYIQKTYEANQFQGQDGLGRAMFGYSDWNQGRLEARNVNGEVRGSYQYIDPFGENVIVNYWSDGLGFHQMDNRRVAQIASVTETPEVKAARLAHLRAWEAAAEAAKENPDPMSDIYNANSNKLDEEQNEFDQTQEILAGLSNQKQSLTRYPNLSDKNLPALKSDIKFNGNDDEDTVAVSAAESRRSQQYERLRRGGSNNNNNNNNNNDDQDELVAQESEEDGRREETTSDPRGFFYNIDYPVQLLVEDNENFIKKTSENNIATKKIPGIAAPPPAVAIMARAPLTTTLIKPLTDSQLAADVVQYKIVPIRILDSQKKNKRSQYRGRRRSSKSVKTPEELAAASTATVSTSTAATSSVIPAEDTPIETVKVITFDHEIPVEIKFDKKSTIETISDVGNSGGKTIDPETSEIFKIKSIAEQEMELRRLGGNLDNVDGVHDAQIHPKQVV